MDYLNQVVGRLRGSGFECLQADQAEVDESTPEWLARRLRFEPSKLGLCETFVFLKTFDTLDLAELATYSANCFGFAIFATRVGTMRGRQYPLRLGIGVISLEVAIVSDADPVLVGEMPRLAPPSRWSALEMPIVYEDRTHQLHYYQKTPLWGAAYYRGLRRLVRELLETERATSGA